jgi:hypothetical protein
MKQFHLSVNGKTLTFSQDQAAQMQSALNEAVQSPGTEAVRSGQFGEIRARLESGHTTTPGNPGAHAMQNQNVVLTDC